MKLPRHKHLMVYAWLVVSLGELFEKADKDHLDFAEAIKLSQIYDRLELLFNHAQKFSFTLEKAGIKNA